MLFMKLTDSFDLLLVVLTAVICIACIGFLVMAVAA
jgi:hypothetical protein